MSYALTTTAIDELCDLTGVQPGPLCQNLDSSDRIHVDRLRQILHDCKTPGYPGDMEVIRGWADYLGFSEWLGIK